MSRWTARPGAENTVSYAVKELFLTLQGEGYHAGRPAVFVRFAGCNLWSGREQDRDNSPSCSRWCDTDFVGTDGSGGGRFTTASQLAVAVANRWPVGGGGTPFLVLTGGEPLLQVDGELIEALHGAGFLVAVETNGTRPLPAPPPDWVTVSPKAGAPLTLTAGDELKLVYPQDGLDPADFEQFDFARFYLQPCDGPARAENTRLAVEYCLRHPRWRLSLQFHKFLGIP
jgi:7-carboxy-7-deazaguanine synthase